MKSTKQKIYLYGFDGVFFVPKTKTDKVMIVITGSDGGLNFACRSAKRYSENGIAALAVALFGTSRTNKNLDRVPVEYIENAINFLRKSGYKRIGIDGMSKGSELAIYSAINFSEISCAVLRVPTYFISEGLINKQPSGYSCWSRRGKELEFTPYPTRKFNLLKQILKEKEYNLLSYNTDKTLNPNSVLNLRELKIPVLLLSSKRDTVWNSFEYATNIYNELKKSNDCFPVKHIAFENIGHLMLHKIGFAKKLLFKSERRNKKICKQERKTLSHEVLQWINGVL